MTGRGEAVSPGEAVPGASLQMRFPGQQELAEEIRKARKPLPEAAAPLICGDWLSATIDVKAHPQLAEKILKARRILRALLQEPAYHGMVEPFRGDRYNSNLSVAENLLFGTPVGNQFDDNNIAGDPYMRLVLRTTGLDLDLQRMGLTIAETIVELLPGLSPDNPIFELSNFISADELSSVRLLLQRLGDKAIGEAPEADRWRLMKLPFRYIEAHHRLGLINATIEGRLMATRRVFAANLPATLRNAVEFYSFSRCNDGATLQDNLLFGRIDCSKPQVEPRIRALLVDVLNKLDLGTALASAKVPVIFSVETPPAREEGGASKEESLDGRDWDVFYASLRSHLQTALGSPQQQLSYLRGRLRGAQLDLRGALASEKVPVTFSVEAPAARKKEEASKETSLEGRDWEVFYASLRSHLLTALGAPQEHIRYLRAKLREALT